MTDPQHRQSQIHKGALVLAVGLALSLIALLLTSCALIKPAPPPDPLAAYRPALRDGFTVDPALLETFLTYSITVKVDAVQRAFTGTVDITVPITGTIPGQELYFRLYPNLSLFAGSVEIASARLNGKSVNYGYAADGTAVHLIPPTPLERGSEAQVRLAFSGWAPRRGPESYSLFGGSDGVLNLTNFYPILAARRGESWALDMADPQGDIGFHDIGLYQVDITAPTGQVMVVSGTAVGAEPAGEGWVKYHYVQGPAREFTLLLSPDFRVEEAQAYGARVRSYYREGHAEVARSALYAAVAALEVYSDTLGAYPYREMAVVEAPLTFHGMEFPGLNLIGTDTYQKHIQDLETRVAHEVAHQWWYNQVGSDQIESPWLDEGVTEFSMYDYFAARYGVPIADSMRKLRWETPVKVAIDGGLNVPIGRPVKAYKGNYETMVYAKGALFLANLQDEVGRDVLHRILRTYLDRYRWRIATPADFQAVAEEVTGRDLDEIFAQWVSG